MNLLEWLNIGLLLALAGAVYWAGMLRQQVSDQENEIKRLRDRLDRFLDPYKHHDRDGC